LIKNTTYSYALGNNFIWTFHSPDNITFPDIMVESVSIPGLTNEHSNVEYQGVTKRVSNSGRAYDSINLTFKINSNYDNWKFIYSWLLSLYDPLTGISNNNKIIHGKLVIMNQDTPIINLMFENLLPTSLTEIPLSTTNASVLTCDVSFNYTKLDLLEE
jgi:hypothetical protein